MTIQDAIVGVLVLAAAAYVLWSLAPSKGCGSGCGKCETVEDEKSRKTLPMA